MKNWTLILVHIWSGSHFELQSWTPFISSVQRLGTAFYLVLPSSNAAKETPTFVGRFQIETSAYIFLWKNIFAQQIISRSLLPTWSSLKYPIKSVHCVYSCKQKILKLGWSLSSTCGHGVTVLHFSELLSSTFKNKEMESCSDPKELWKEGPQRAQITQRAAQREPCWCWSVTLQHKVQNDTLTSYLKPRNLSGYLH